MAAAIEQVVTENAESILLIYIDVIEFKGKHIRTFYQQMADRSRSAYADRIAEMKRKGEVAEGVDPLVGVMLATRWFFYYFTVEKCFGVPMHLGLEPRQAVQEFAKVLRYGLLSRPEAGASDPQTEPRLATRGGKDHVHETRRPDA
jgi:hypothetical protein